MPYTKINTDYVSGQSYLAVNGMNTLQNCHGTVAGLGVHYKILWRYSISSRLSSLRSSLSNMESRLASIHHVVGGAANLYAQVDQSLARYYQTGKLQSVFTGAGNSAGAAAVSAAAGSSFWGDASQFLGEVKPVFSNIKDARKALSQLLKAWKGWDSGLRIVQKGNYYIIKGTRDMEPGAIYSNWPGKGIRPGAPVTG